MASRDKRQSKFDTEVWREPLETETAQEDAYTLEEILAEYGSSRQQKILEEVERETAPLIQPEEPKREELSGYVQEPTTEEVIERPAPPPKSARDLWHRRVEAEKARQAAEQAEQPMPEDLPGEEPLEEPPLLSLEELVGTTVDAVMEEDHKEPLLKPRRGLFSRRKLEETERFYDPVETPPPPIPVKEEPMEDEPDLSEAAAEHRADYRERKRSLAFGLVTALLPLAALTAERYGLTIPFWTGDRMIQGIVLLVLLLIQLVLCRQVPVYGFRRLRDKRVMSALLMTVAALAAAADCVLWLLVPERRDAMPYAPTASLGLWCVQWGISRESRGCYDSFRTAAVSDTPPYLVTETPRGACKQRGSVPGFYTTAVRDDLPAVLQTVFMPLVFMASIVFAGLTSLAVGRDTDFLLDWSAILLAGTTFALPLCWGLPWSRLARRQQKNGCAVAGWDGAARVSKHRSVILTDTDLFPPGTIRLNGVKVYGEEMGHAAAYAAAVSKAAGCGLARLFEGLAVGEGVLSHETVQDLSFYEQGGWGCTIHGESVLLGTASFMRKQDVRLPGNINLKTGIFLAVDHQLTAVYAVKYEAAENVDYALRMLRRSRITPILAVRDPNITPALLKRKFYKGFKGEYPDLTDRVALSEVGEDRGSPRALLLREGLLPYAEAVVGSRRLRTAVRRASWLSLAGSAAGLLLTGYLASLEKFDLMTPLTLTIFLLLWTLPVLLMSDWTGRY